MTVIVHQFWTFGALFRFRFCGGSTQQSNCQANFFVYASLAGWLAMCTKSTQTNCIDTGSWHFCGWIAEVKGYVLWFLFRCDPTTIADIFMVTHHIHRHHQWISIRNRRFINGLGQGLTIFKPRIQYGSNFDLDILDYIISVISFSK